MIRIKLFALCLTAVLYTPINLNGQDFSFGLGVGIIDAGMYETSVPSYAEDRYEYHPDMSVHLNAYLAYQLDSTWTLSCEPGYIGKGAYQDLAEESNGDDITYRFDYIQLPVLLEWHFHDHLYLTGGPELAYLVEARTIQNELTTTVTHFYDRLELSAELGLHYGLTELLHFGLKYNHGLTSIIKKQWTDENGNFIGSSREYNRYLQLSVQLIM